MNYKYDKQIDALYIRFSDAKYAYGKDLDEDRRIDYDVNGGVIGVELHCISLGVDLDRLPRPSDIEIVLRKVGVKLYA